MPGREFPRKSCDREFRRPRASHQIRRQRRVRLSTDCALTQIDARRHLTCRQISGMGRRIWNRTVCRDFTDRVSACARRNSSYHISTVHEARRGTSRLGARPGSAADRCAVARAPLGMLCSDGSRNTPPQRSGGACVLSGFAWHRTMPDAPGPHLAMPHGVFIARRFRAACRPRGSHSGSYRNRFRARQ